MDKAEIYRIVDGNGWHIKVGRILLNRHVQAQIAAWTDFDHHNRFERSLIRNLDVLAKSPIPIEKRKRWPGHPISVFEYRLLGVKKDGRFEVEPLRPSGRDVNEHDERSRGVEFGMGHFGHLFSNEWGIELGPKVTDGSSTSEPRRVGQLIRWYTPREGRIGVDGLPEKRVRHRSSQPPSKRRKTSHGSPQTDTKDRPLFRLPQEIIDELVSYLSPIEHMSLKMSCQYLHDRMPCLITFKVARLENDVLKFYGEKVFALEYHLPAKRVEGGRPIPERSVIADMCEEMESMGIPTRFLERCLEEDMYRHLQLVGISLPEIEKMRREVVRDRDSSLCEEG